MMMFVVNLQSFQLLQPKGGNSWDAGKLKETATKRFEALDTNRNGQIDRNEAAASGGLFGIGNFVIDNQSANSTDAWAAAAGTNQSMSLRELIALGLYIDGTKSASNPNNQMDGIITARESTDVMSELSKTNSNPYLAPKLYNTIDLNAQNFGLDQFVSRELEQVESVNRESVLPKKDNQITESLLRKTRDVLALIPTLNPSALNTSALAPSALTLPTFNTSALNPSSGSEKPKKRKKRKKRLFGFGGLFKKLFGGIKKLFSGGLKAITGLFSGGLTGLTGLLQGAPTTGSIPPFERPTGFFPEK